MNEQAEAYAQGYRRGYDVAAARAESRAAAGLPLEHDAAGEPGAAEDEDA